MLMISYIDWFGTDEEFEKFKKVWEDACKEAKGVHSTKCYIPHTAKYHYAWFTKADSYADMMEANNIALSKLPRDRNKMTHSVVEVFQEM
jgi:hypothetical protein